MASPTARSSASRGWYMASSRASRLPSGSRPMRRGWRATRRNRRCSGGWEHGTSRRVTPRDRKADGGVLQHAVIRGWPAEPEKGTWACDRLVIEYNGRAPGFRRSRFTACRAHVSGPEGVRLN
eukprot:6952922-Prymnesium_polylepis.1